MSGLTDEGGGPPIREPRIPSDARHVELRAAAVGGVLSVPVHRFWLFTEDCPGLCIIEVLGGGLLLAVGAGLAAWLGCRLARVPRASVVAVAGLLLGASWSYLMGGLVWGQRTPMANPPPPLVMLVLVGSIGFWAAALVIGLRRRAAVKVALLAVIAVTPLLAESLVRGALA
ncbi:hypothetical protein [Actinoplanes flavus]|uniref:Uncharacterized protein n=1 Tax=Actinoplanes flavus TaxID=2820290 RepID=A0ABS3V0P8_9ACTN|nr:hypothetical protein [Actinoplanes flavus]MBO3744394.1 hypothetical protein [Actinoplanes flavus]